MKPVSSAGSSVVPAPRVSLVRRLPKSRPVTKTLKASGSVHSRLRSKGVGRGEEEDGLQNQVDAQAQEDEWKMRYVSVLLLAAMPVICVEETYLPADWDRIEVKGYLTTNDLPGDRHKEIFLVQKIEGYGPWWNLSFGSEKDEEWANLNMSMLCKATLIRTRRGWGNQYLVEKITRSP